MAIQFKVETIDGTKEVDAFSFQEKGTFVVFADGSGSSVYAVPTARVASIERIDKQA